MRKIILPLILIATATMPGAALAAVTFYDDPATFDANANTGALLDLDSLAPINSSIFLGTPGEVDLGPLTVSTNGPLFAQNNNLWGTGGFLSAQQLQGATITFSIDNPVTAFALNYAAGASIDASVRGSNSILAPISVPPFMMAFFGVTSDTPFSIVTLTMSGDGADIDNIRFGSQSVADVPEPSTWAMILCGFGAIGLVVRRRRRPTRPEPTSPDLAGSRSA